MIHLTRQLSLTNPWTSRNVPGPSAGAVGDDSWSAKAPEWDVCCVAPYPTVSAEQCAPILFYLTLHCIGLSAEPLSDSGFAPTTFFFDSAWMPNNMSSTASFTVIHPLCIRTNNCRSRTTHESCSLGNTCFEPSSHYNMPSIKVA
ncbi:uncharacterized protein TNCV_804671 [Trichonephila clavipes]|nr:uncharacterized protein TNCV_804671 [Trichonephila clavipes]